MAHVCRAAQPLGTPPSAFWYQNAYELLTTCSSVPAAQCCNGVGHAFAQNSTQYDGTAMKFNSAAFQLFSMNVRVRPSLYISIRLREVLMYCGEQ